MGIVTQLRRNNAPQLDTESLAAAYLFQVRWESRTRALSFCIEQLMARHDMPVAAAELAAMQAYASLEAVNQRERIDLDASTSDLVVLRTEGAAPVMFTTADLVHLLEQARADGRTQHVDPIRRRPVVLEH